MQSLRETIKAAATAVLGERAYRELHARAVVKRLRKAMAQPDATVERLIEDHLSPGDTCIDIGAHTGEWTYQMAQRVGGQGRVYAFEAAPHYAAVIRRAMALLRVDNVVLHDLALSREDGAQALITHDDQGHELTGRTHLRGSDEPVPQAAPRVQTARLDTLAEQDDALNTAAMIKCDVEGAELWVFEGAQKLLARARPVVFCEVQEEHCLRYGHEPAAVFQLFEDMGYSRQQVTPADYLFLP